MTEIIRRINCYPLKGFPAQRLTRTQLSPNHGIAFDRRVAITNAQRALEPNGQWTACQAFVRLTKNISRNRFEVRFDEEQLRLMLRHPDGEFISVQLEILRPIDRCSATSVNKTTSLIDVNVPALLARTVGLAYYRGERDTYEPLCSK